MEAIPLWVFTVRHVVPNPNKDDKDQDPMVQVVKPYVVSGSSNVATFSKVFETIQGDAQAAARMRSQAPKL